MKLYQYNPKLCTVYKYYRQQYEYDMNYGQKNSLKCNQAKPVAGNIQRALVHIHLNKKTNLREI